MGLSNLMSLNNQFNTFLPRKNNNTFFKGDLMRIIQKYPMLWGWLLDMDATNTHYSQEIANQVTHALNNTYGIQNNPVAPNPNVALAYQVKNPNTTTIANDKLVLQYLQTNKYLAPNENIKTIVQMRQYAQKKHQENETLRNQLSKLHTQLQAKQDGAVTTANTQQYQDEISRLKKEIAYQKHLYKIIDKEGFTPNLNLSQNLELAHIFAKNPTTDVKTLRGKYLGTQSNNPNASFWNNIQKEIQQDLMSGNQKQSVFTDGTFGSWTTQKID